MFKHTINYTDFNGVEREEDFYFHLSTPEVTRLHAEIGGEIEEHTKLLIARNDVDALLQFLEKLVLTAYGQKTVDGRSFEKSPELRRQFEYSNAYAELFETMLTDKDFAIKFGESVVDRPKSSKAAPAAVKTRASKK